MRTEPYSYQSIAAAIPDPPDYVEDADGEIVDCQETSCDEGAVGRYGDQDLCDYHVKYAYAADHADTRNDERWEER